MRKKKLLIGAIMSLSLIIASCDSSIEDDISRDNIASEVTTRSFGDPRGELVALKVHPDSLKKKITPYMQSADQTLSENLFALERYPIMLKSTSANKYLTVNGAWEEVTLISHDNKNTIPDELRFYIRNFPASSGIPYMIYSVKSNTPLCVGYYTNNPDEKILLTQQKGDSDIYSATWDIYPATTSNYGEAKSNGAVVIESQSYLSQGTGGSWDVYWNVWKATNDGKMRYGRYTRSSDQEFIIQPIGTFMINSIEYVDAYNVKKTLGYTSPKTEVLTNTDPLSEKVDDFVFTVNVQETSRFNEQKGIDFDTTPIENFYHPVIEKDGTIILNPSTSSLVPYDRYSEWTKPIKIDEPVTIPPSYKAVLTYQLEYYTVEVNYIAKATVGDKTIKLPGKWVGVLYTGNYKKDLRKAPL